MFKWDGKKDYETNINAYVDSIGAVRIAKQFLKGESIGSENDDNYRDNLGQGTLVEHLFLDRFEEIGEVLATQIVNKAMKAGFMDSSFIPKSFNRKFRYDDIPHNADYLCQLLTPYIPTRNLFSGNQKALFNFNLDYGLPYFKAINDRITLEQAIIIYDYFEDDGYFSEEAINYLIDNNKYIQRLVTEYGEHDKFPNKDVRDIFIF